jgi:outer membrane protein OmpA-like peptidoglycan-associated protein
VTKCASSGAGATDRLNVGSSGLRAGVLALCASAACYSTGEIRAQNDVVRLRLDQARKGDAYRCAPEELARAEANFDFSEQELRAGRSIPSHQFSLVAQENLKKALEKVRACPPLAGPALPPPPPPSEVAVAAQASKDTDNDGLTDDIDRCPLIPGPRENFGCPWGDRDNDGVPDNLDACPDQPGIAELKGCPDVDTDKDGIPDRLDKCPTVPGVPELQGCPDKDSDGDGVVDRLDRCPTVPGLPPDGCPKKYSLVTVRSDRIEIHQQIRFASSKAKILRPSFALLNQITSALRDSPQLKIRVEGHTDNVGNRKKNLQLSQQRASAVRTYLVDHGIDEGRLSAVGYGSSHPIASNSTKAGKAQNRRVEFKFVEPPAAAAQAPGEAAAPPAAAVTPPPSPAPSDAPAAVTP